MDPVSSKKLPESFLKKTFSLINNNSDRNSLSLVCKDWYNIERVTRRHVSISNCYSVSPEILAARFPEIRSVTLKGKPRFSDFNLVPDNWGGDVQPWLNVFATAYPFLEELRLKRMEVSDESLEFLGMNFDGFKVLSLLSCDGFTTLGLEAIATHCKNLTELDIQENGIDDLGGDWLSFFPESLTSLEVLNFATLNSEVSFDALETLVSRCKSLRVLKVNRNISLDQLQKLLVLAPQLTELGTGTFTEDLVSSPVKELESAFSICKNLHTVSGFWDATLLYLPAVYPVCDRLTFLNLSYASLGAVELEQIISHCKQLTRLWVLDTVGDKGLEAVGSCCPLLEELRVFPADPFDQKVGVTESGLVAVSNGCPKLHYILYFCQRMTNAAVITVAQNCLDFTHFRLCIMNPREPDYLSNEPMDEAFGAIVKICTKLRRLSVSGLLTDLAFEYIGKYAKNLETLSIAFAGSSDLGMEYVMRGCPKLKRVEIRDCPFGDSALLSGLGQYKSMRSLWMSACNVTMNGCKKLAEEMPMLNVEVIKDEDGDDSLANKVYVYRTVAGPRKDTPPFVLTL
uniref:protein TRANSPORT INHIBITOR RESPONSE 1-like n=1 Tax=Erigeron canadensis TaxID=72917 RepID=UPI001CB94017|nr:protein TRANSPORT INHIBITOR RESPONSE 1-like [Erigeron canadensis]